MSGKTKSDLERSQELFELLQGRLPEGYKIEQGHVPNLTPNQAWTVIWYLGDQYWQVPDHVDRCCICGELYDSDEEGRCLDYGEGPYFFCENCMNTDAYATKVASDPTNN
jgi:hypothetical protein